MISRSLFTHFSPSFTDYSSLNISSHRFTRSGEYLLLCGFYKGGAMGERWKEEEWVVDGRDGYRKGREG